MTQENTKNEDEWTCLFSRMCDVLDTASEDELHEIRRIIERMGY